MKNIALLIILLLQTHFILAQKRTKIFFRDFVECYYPEDIKEPISIHQSPNGKIIAKLDVLTQQYCWYKFAISESKDGWLKIENVIVLPACEKNELNEDIGKYKGKWILAKNMEIDLPDNGVGNVSDIDYHFYEKPDTSSKIAFTTNEFSRTYLIAVDGTWAKVNIVKDGKKYSGWLQRKYQCPYPWTTCPVWN